MLEGRVKFFKAEKGWGAIVCDSLPTDVWVHYSSLEMEGHRSLDAGDVVELEVEEAEQDSFHLRATRVRKLRSGPAPTLRRIDERVEIVPDGTPETPLTPRRGPAGPETR